MRLLIILILGISTVGCGSVSSRTEREIALLRAEILDLGDQYGDLKSRHRRALADLSACKGEPVSDYFPDSNVAYYGDINESYYPERQIIGNGFVHTGTPDCCADCERVYNGYGGTEIIDGGSTTYLPTDPVINLSPQNNFNQTPAIDPIITPFEETPSTDGPEPVPSEPVQGGTASRSTLTPRERFLARQAGHGWTERGEALASTQVPDAEPAFRPDRGQWAQRSQTRLPQESDLADLVVTEGQMESSGSTAQPWQQASGRNQGPISNTPLDDRFIGEPFEGATVSSASIEQLYVDPENSYAIDYDKDGGDDGIRLLIQPLDLQGEIVPRGAQLVVSLIDPNEIGEAQRIGLWKFEAYQVESFVSNERGRRGLLLDLPWQRRMPGNENLIVFVRYITDSGRKLESSLDIKVVPPQVDDEFQMLDPVARQAKPAAPAKANSESAKLPKWRPVR